MHFRFVYVWVLSQCSSGVDYDRSKIVFATAGLAARWYASQGYYMWHNYGGVLFDEIDQMAMDPEYASLWESAREEAKKRKFRVFGASATYGDAMKAYLTEQGAQWIKCAERPFSVQRYELEVPTQE